MNILRLSTLSSTLAIVVMTLGFVNLAFAAKPGACTPWPACKGGGGDPPEPPAGNPVILAEDEGGKARLVAMDADGSNVVTVLNEGLVGASAQWAPGGTYVAYFDISTNVGSGICPASSLKMVPYDDVSNTWGNATVFFCFDASHLAGNHFEIIPPLQLDDSTAQVLMRADGQGDDITSLLAGGIHLTSTFTPGDSSGDEVSTVQIIDNAFEELNLPGNVGTHDPALSRSTDWLIYQRGDPNVGNIYESFAIRRFYRSVITPDLENMDPDDVTGPVAVEIFSNEIGPEDPHDVDFAEHAEETFVFSANGHIYCVDFSNVNDDPNRVESLKLADIEWVNLTASPGLLPDGSSALHPTWRPDGSGVVFGLWTNPGTSSDEHVIAAIEFGTPNFDGCPVTPTVANSTFRILAGGGTKRRSPVLEVPIYWRNAQ
jgi:hypothetical protein